MLISFSGAQSTGKSTLLQQCKLLYSDQFTFVEEITRRIAKRGLEINQNGGNFTQLLVINSHIENCLLDNAILDRCILDGLIYTEYLHNHSKVAKWVVDYAENVFHTIVHKYTKIFYTSPDDVQLVGDGVRSIGIEGDKFRNDIIKRFNYYIENDARLEGKVVVLKGTVEQRMKTIQENLDL